MFPADKRIEAVTTYLALGNLRQVAAVCEVGYYTIKQWKTQPWWKDAEAEIVATKRIATNSKLGAIVEKSLDVIDDRLTNGDLVLNNKTGALVRKDVSLRDATSAANALMQRQAILEKLVRDEVVSESTQSIADQLKNLATEFAKFNTNKKLGATDVAFKESVSPDEYYITEEKHSALYDPWEEGLSEGSGQIHESPRSGEEADGTECSSPRDGEEGVGPQG